MGACECCGEREGDVTTSGSDWAEVSGVRVSWLCWKEHKGATGLVPRIRARRAEVNTPRDTAPCPPPSEPPPPSCRTCSSPATTRGYCEYCYHREFKEPKCRSCSSPATHGEFCVYCSDSLDGVENEDRANIDETTAYQMRIGKTSAGTPIPGELAARARLAAMDRAERPRQTAESRELAKAHPWECQDD